MKDFLYYRCSGSDGYRFGGERICSNSQVQGAFLETTVWREVSSLLMNPERIEREHRELSSVGTLLDNLEILKSQRTKLQHAMEMLIDSFTEGVIEKDQFTSRMARTKSRIADLDAKIKAEASDADQLEHLRLATARLRIGVLMKLMRHSNIGTTGKYGDAYAKAKLRTNRKVAGRLLPTTFRSARRQARQ
jgi:site-specific DNA recombinase